MKPNQVHCKNCEQPFDDNFQFCPHCGQKSNDELTIGVLFYNTISNYFSFDARFFKSFIPLLFKPGYLAKEFIKGKRLLYLHPAQMYLFISVVFFFIFSFTVREQTNYLNEEFKITAQTNNSIAIDSLKLERLNALERNEIRETLESVKPYSGMTQKEIDSIVALDESSKKNQIAFGSIESEIDSLIKAGASDKTIYKTMGMEDDAGWFKRKFYEQFLKFFKTRDVGNVLNLFYDTIPIALFFVLPIFALIIKMLYFRKGRYAHHLVFSFYYFSFLFTVLSVIFGVNLIYEISDWIDFFIALSCFIYLFIALKRFYGQGWLLSFVKASVSTIFFTPIVGIVAIAILFFAFLFY